MKKWVLLILSFGILSCQKDSQEIFYPIEEAKSISNRNDTVYFEFVYDNQEKSAALNSRLKEKANNLVGKDVKWNIKRVGKIKKSSSTFFKAIVNKPEICYNRSNCYKVKDLKQFEIAIDAIHYAQIDFIKMNSFGDTIKAGVEEIIFYNQEDAQTILDYINWVREVEYFWNTLDKSGSYLIRENNKIYFVKIRNMHVSRYYPKIIANMLKA